MRADLQSDRAGRVTRVGDAATGFDAFVPRPLPPAPALDLTPRAGELHEQANRALGRMDGAASILPDPDLFLYSYVRKEAVLSAQIEGTQSTLVDLLKYEAEPHAAPQFDEVREVSNYVAAVEHCMHRLREEDFPLSLRLIREAHGILLRSGRGEGRTPGEFRRSQNWIGGTRPGNAVFVPPPPNEVPACMDALERYIHESRDMPLVIRAGLVHAQFESIHPFLDGNGRVGRMLITLMLCAEGALSRPLLYVSLFLKEHRSEYYNRLSAVRFEGDWEGWIEFYLEGILEVAGAAADVSQRIWRMFEDHRELVRARTGRSANRVRLLAMLARRPVVTAGEAAAELEVTEPTARHCITDLQDLGLLSELTGRTRARLYGYMPYIAILAEGTTEAPG